MSLCPRRRTFLAAMAAILSSAVLPGASILTHPYVGISYIVRTEVSPRNLVMHIVQVDLTAPGLSFLLSPAGGTREVFRQTTTNYLNQQGAAVAVNGMFFLPFPSSDLNAMVIGLGASNGDIYSAFEAPVQSYALVTNSPAINIDPNNVASVVHADTSFADGKHVLENVTLWNTLSGSAQIVTNGAKTIPVYQDATHPDGLLTLGGPANYSNSNSWYNLLNARSSIGLSQDRKTLTIFTVDVRGGSQGMAVGEVADLLIQDYGVYDALNIDGGGSTSLALRDPHTGIGKLVNVSSDSANGRLVANSLAIFATPVPEPSTAAALGIGTLFLVLFRTRRK